MKLVDITEFWSERGGGVRSYLTSKAHTLPKLGVEHRVLASGPRNEESVLAEDGRAKSCLVRFAGPKLPYDPSYHLLSRPLAVRRRLSRESADVLEIHSPQLAALNAISAPSSSFRIRTLLWHSDFIDTYLTWRLEQRVSHRSAAALTEPLWAWVRAVAGRCATTLVASHWQASKLRAHGVPRVTELPFGVDTSVFRPQARDGAFRAQFLANRNAKLLVAAGRLAEEKRTDVIIDAFRRLRAEREATLLIVGDGPERPRLEAQTRGLPDVVFLGFERDRARLARALASADLLLHAGPFETFGLVVAEARACATPVVVADSGAAAEAAAPASSEIYKAADAEALAAAALRLLARDPTTLGERAREGALSVLSVEAHFRRLLAIYRDLLPGAPRPH